MSLGTLERDAPSMFKHGPSGLTQLLIYSALTVVLMVADARFKITEPVRQAVSTVLYPVQWTLLHPVRWVMSGKDYLETVEQAQRDSDLAHRQMASMALQIREVHELTAENAHLRQLLELRPRLTVPAKAAQVVYESPDSYTRRVVVDKGQVAGVVPGSPVMDERGVMGQVTRVQPFTSEVSLLVDRDQAIPVLIERSGVRSVAYGDASNLRADGIELRFVPIEADVEVGDVLTTSGVDGVYPPGLPVAKVVKVERRADTAFTRIYCEPLARMQGARHVMVLTPLDDLKAAEHPELVVPPVVTPEAQAQAREDKSASRRAGGREIVLPGQAPKKEAAP